MKKFILTLIFLILINTTVYGTEKTDPEVTYNPCYEDTHGLIFYSDKSTQIIKEINYKFLYVNGSVIKNPMIITENNLTLVPIRIITESLGGKVEWNDKERIVTITDEKIIILKIDSDIAKVNGEEIKLSVKPKIINGYTYLPLRFVAENMNSNVYYAEKYEPKTIVRNNINIIIDRNNKNDKIISKEEAVENTKVNFKIAVQNLDKNFSKFYSKKILESMTDSSTPEKEIKSIMIEAINKNIEKTKIIDEVSRYYIIEGVYNVLYDKYTGDIYLNFLFDGGKLSIHKADFENMSFETGYLAG